VYEKIIVGMFGVACKPKLVKIANESDGQSSKCLHLWTNRKQRVDNVDACVTEAFARSGNVINYHPERQSCNVKRCKPATSQLQYNDVMYDVVVNDHDVTALDYRLTDAHGGWDVYGIICKYRSSVPTFGYGVGNSIFPLIVW